MNDIRKKKLMQEKFYTIELLNEQIEKIEIELDDLKERKNSLQVVVQNWEVAIPQLKLEKELNEWRDEIAKTKNDKYALEVDIKALLKQRLIEEERGRELSNYLLRIETSVIVQNKAKNSLDTSIEFLQTNIKDLSESIRSIELDLRDKTKELKETKEAIIIEKGKKVVAENEAKSVILEKEKEIEDLNQSKKKYMEQIEYYTQKEIELKARYEALCFNLEEDYKAKQQKIEEEIAVLNKKKNEANADVSDKIAFVNKTILELRTVRTALEEIRKKRINIVIPEEL